MDFNKKKRLQHEGTSHNPFQQNIWGDQVYNVKLDPLGYWERYFTLHHHITI